MENNNFDNTPDNQQQANFSTNDIITVVDVKTENKNNKLPIILIICVLAIALISGIVLFVLKSQEPEKTPETIVTEGSTAHESYDAFDEFYSEVLQESITDANGNEISREEYLTQIQQQLQEATTVLSQFVGNASPNEIVENTTNASQTETTTADTQHTVKAEAQIKAFFNRSFYLRGALYTGGTGDPICMSMDGDNFDILTNLDGTELSFLKIGDTMFIKRSATKQYVELNESFFDMLGIEPGMMNFDFGNVSYDSIKNNIKTANVTINGNPGLCYSYKNDTQSFKFYAENGELRQIEIYDADGVRTSEFAIDYFSESIPGDQLSLKGYEKTGMATMFADLM